MRLRHFLLPFVLIAALLSTATVNTGCAPAGPLQDKQNYAAVNDAFISAAQTLLVARDAGVFSPEEWVEEIAPLLVVGSTLLDSYYNVLYDGNETSALELLREVRRILTELEPYIERALAAQEGGGS
jgi:hypothetical protein